jgi:hypothetical protein
LGRGGVNGNSLRVTAADLRGAGLVRGQVPLTPGRESLRMSDRPARATGFSQGRQQFFSHMQSSHVDRVPFAQQQRGIQQSTQHSSNAPESLNRTASGGATARSNASTGASGWRQVGEPAAQQRAGSEAWRPSSPSGAESWQRFGTPAGRSSGGYGGYNSGQPVRIAPQIVHERPSTGGGYSGYPSRGGYSAPAYHAAPASSNRGSSAPAHSSGGGGGGHSSGGGGGHSSGGGGGHGSHR